MLSPIRVSDPQQAHNVHHLVHLPATTTGRGKLLRLVCRSAHRCSAPDRSARTWSSRNWNQAEEEDHSPGSSPRISRRAPTRSSTSPTPRPSTPCATRSGPSGSWSTAPGSSGRPGRWSTSASTSGARRSGSTWTAPSCCAARSPRAWSRAGWGRIVNLASIAAKDGNPTQSAYSASKAAVVALTKSLGKELATTGVLVNAVAPAAVETPDERPHRPGDPRPLAGADARWAGSGGRRRSRSWWRGCARRPSASRPERCTTSAGAGRRTEPRRSPGAPAGWCAIGTTARAR